LIFFVVHDGGFLEGSVGFEGVYDALIMVQRLMDPARRTKLFKAFVGTLQ
jgi:hypothetical protein